MILNAGQEKIRKEAVDWFYNSPSQVFEIEGAAGTGKSVLVFEIFKSLGLKQNQVLPMAYTGQAAIVMRTKGFTASRSIHSALYECVEVLQAPQVNNMFSRPVKTKQFQKRTFIDPEICLFFIDEAYMVPDWMVKDILSFGVKVIACGDSHQLPPINASPAFLANPGCHHLTQLMRQEENNPIVYLANRAMKGLPIHCGTYGNVLVINDDEFCPQMVGYADCILCGTNRSRDMINKYVRALAGFRGDLPKFSERVICRNNNWEISLEGISLANGLSGTVINNPDPADSYTGDFYINFKPDLIDGAFMNLLINYNYFIAPYDEKQSIKGGNLDYIKGELFEFSYALTTHLAQGAEYRRGLYFEEFLRPQIMNQLNYTAITRFREGMIYIKKKNKYINIPNV